MEAKSIQKIREEIIFDLKKSINYFFAEIKDRTFYLEQPKLIEHGDFSSNIALQITKELSLNPREIAKKIISNLECNEIIKKIEIAGPGFINFYLTDIVKQKTIENVFNEKESFGSNDVGKGKKIQIEYVSANPTGPIHIGHGRGAALGGTLSNILIASFFDHH